MLLYMDTHYWLRPHRGWLRPLRGCLMLIRGWLMLIRGWLRPHRGWLKLRLRLAPAGSDWLRLAQVFQRLTKASEKLAQAS